MYRSAVIAPHMARTRNHVGVTLHNIVAFRLTAKIPFLAVAVLAFLVVLGYFSMWVSVPPADAQEFEPHVFDLRVLVDGGPAPDGTLMYAWMLDGEVQGSALTTRGGEVTLILHQPSGQWFRGEKVEFRAKSPDGHEIVFPQTSFWIPGGSTRMVVEGKGLVQRPVLQPFPRSPQPYPQRPPPTDFGSTSMPAPHTFQGEVVINGRPAEDGTRVNAFVDGVQIIGTRVKGGFFTIAVPQPIGKNFVGKTVEFRGRTPDGRGLRWRGFYRWQPRGRTNVTLEIRTEPSPFDPGAPSIECVVKVLGRIPRGFDDINTRDQMRIAQECMDFGGGGFGAPDIDHERARLELERALQAEQQELDKNRLEAERALQREQASLEQERLERERAMEESQARLEEERLQRDRDRLKREGDFQEEQRRLNQERFEQEQQRLKEEQQLDLQQQMLEEERRARQRQQEESDFKAEQARLRREVELNLQRQKFELEQRARMTVGLPPLPPEKFPPPGENETKDEGPRRGFFSNTTVGGLGTANDLMDPTMLAVIGIVLTLSATMLQMVRGN